MEYAFGLGRPGRRRDERMRGLGFTNPVGTGGLDQCLEG